VAASAELAKQARTVAAAFQAEHGRPISRDTLRRALHVSNRVAGELLHAVRAPTEVPPSVPAPPADGTPAGTAPTAAGGTATEPSPVPVTGPAGNGHRPDPGDQPAPASPSLSSSLSRSPVRVP
jgi:hypothetical protein